MTEPSGLRRGQRWTPADGGAPRVIDNVEPHADLVEYHHWLRRSKVSHRSSRVGAFHAWVRRTRATTTEAES